MVGLPRDRLPAVVLLPWISERLPEGRGWLPDRRRCHQRSKRWTGVLQVLRGRTGGVRPAGWNRVRIYFERARLARLAWSLQGAGCLPLLCDAPEIQEPGRRKKACRGPAPTSSRAAHRAAYGGDALNPSEVTGSYRVGGWATTSPWSDRFAQRHVATLAADAWPDRDIGSGARRYSFFQVDRCSAPAAVSNWVPLVVGDEPPKRTSSLPNIFFPSRRDPGLMER